MPANMNTLAELIKQYFELPFVKNLQRHSWLYNLFGSKPHIGAKGIEWKVHYAGNSSPTSYDLDDNPPAAGSQAYKEAKLPHKRNWATIQIDGLLEASARGREAAFMAIEASEISGVLLDLIQKMNTQFWGDGTGNSSKDITGIKAAVNATGTYAGLDRATYTWWQSYMQDAGGAVDLTEDLVTSHIDTFLGDSLRGVVQSELVGVTSRLQWRKLGRDIQDKHGSRREQSTNLAGGQTAVMVDNIPIIAAPDMPTADKRLYFFSLPDIKYRPLTVFDVEPLGRTRDAKEATVKCYGNLQARNPRKHSCLYNLAN